MAGELQADGTPSPASKKFFTLAAGWLGYSGGEERVIYSSGLFGIPRMETENARRNSIAVSRTNACVFLVRNMGTTKPYYPDCLLVIPLFSANWTTIKSM